MIVVTPLLEIGFIFVSAYIDQEHLKDKDYIESHVSRVVLRSIVGITFCFINPYYGLGYFFWFVALFSPMINKLKRNKVSIWTLGKTASYDKFFRKHPILYKITVITSLILGIYFNFKGI